MPTKVLHRLIGYQNILKASEEGWEGAASKRCFGRFGITKTLTCCSSAMF